MGYWSKGLMVFLLSCSLLGCGISGGNSDDTVVQQEEKAPLRLEMAQTQYTLEDEEWKWQIINETGEAYSMLHAPLLEQQQSDGSWQEVPCQAGFCGVEDPVQEVMSGSALAEWYPGLQAGVYRLSYRISIDTETKEYISAQFEIVE